MSKRRRDARREGRRKSVSSLDGLEGLSPKKMQKALGQIDSSEVENVVEVIVRTTTEEIVLLKPEVTIMNVGQEIWNIVPQGKLKRPLSSPSDQPIQDIEVKEDDVKLVMSTAGVSEDKAIQAIKQNSGDIAAAIMSLK
ncbi:MAG: nascent polypeptide-associated complex protein [Candidatus Heimdallarchaeota archaeon]|nr:nascent polypeptide-associated complex protein [Candidatus Heimdallarchaeota archaeon]MDH5644515.1 nascent polypeptide-associated complex protein [Candidatus Heimdallarchaeota archaeon]